MMPRHDDSSANMLVGKCVEGNSRGILKDRVKPPNDAKLGIVLPVKKTKKLME
jgi:hypothetical protein